MPGPVDPVLPRRLMGVQLTAGSVARLHYAEPDEEDIFNYPHTLQLLYIKKINTSGTDRYRIILSDGENYCQAMLTTQLNSMVQTNSIEKHTVVLVDRMTSSFIQEKRYVLYSTKRPLLMTHFSLRLLIVSSLRIVENPLVRIGNPVLVPDIHNTVSAPPVAVLNAITNPSMRFSSSGVEVGPFIQPNYVTPVGKKTSNFQNDFKMGTELDKVRLCIDVPHLQSENT